MALTTIPDTFGTGGSGLNPTGTGTPTLAGILQEHKAAIDGSSATNGVVQKRTLAVTTTTFAAVTTNGLAGTFAIGAALPTNARILGCELTGNANFTGGGATSVTLSVGGTGTTDVVNAADVFGGGTGNRHGTLGPNPNGNLGGQQLNAIFTPDGAHNLAALTTGTTTITVFYTVLA